jgi:lysozyme
VKTGADISHWQGSYSPASYKAAGEDFIILKATESTTYVDPTFKGRWAASRSAGVPRAAYHFARPGTATVDAQADHFIRTLRAAGWVSGDGWVLDMEDAGGVGPAGLTVWAERFCTRVRSALGGRGVFYSYIPFIRGNMGNPGRVPAGCLAWVARYAASPYQAPHPCPKGWPDPPDIWQCSDGTSGCVKTVASIGRCDYNRMTDAAYRALFTAGGATAAWWEGPLSAAELAQIRGAFVEALQ